MIGNGKYQNLSPVQTLLRRLMGDGTKILPVLSSDPN